MKCDWFHVVYHILNKQKHGVHVNHPFNSLLYAYSIYTEEAFLHYPDYKGSLISPQN